MCGDNFAIYTYIKSLCYTPETNAMLYANYISMHRGKQTSYFGEK